MDLKQTVQNLISYIKRLFSRTSQLYYDYEFQYRERVQKLLNYYDGMQIEYLMNELNAQFVNPTMLKFQPRIVNITKYITDNLCMLFSKGVIVKANNDLDADIYEAIVDSCNLEATLSDLERKTFLVKTALLKVCWRNDGIALDVITPEYVIVNQSEENPYEIESIIYPIKLESKNLYNPKGVFARWTATEYNLIDENGKIIVDPNNPNGENPYGIIPIVTFRSSVPNNGIFFNVLGEELLNAQASINTLLTSQAYLIKMQSFSQPVIKNPSTNLKGEINVIVDPSAPIIIQDSKDNPGSFEYVTPQARLAELQDTIDKEILRIGALFGVNVSDFIASGQKSSADATKEYNASINEYRQAQKLLYLPLLNELFEVIRVVWNTHSVQQLTEEGVTIQIMDPDRGYTSVDDMIKKTDYMLSKNFINTAQAAQMWLDDISEEEAKEMIMENTVENALMNGDISADDLVENEVEASDKTIAKPAVPYTDHVDSDMHDEMEDEAGDANMTDI